MSVPGVPVGWELVRIGCVESDEWYVDADGKARRHTGNKSPFNGWAIIRRIAPICIWQHGVFADGWLVQDKDHDWWFHFSQPTAQHTKGYWVNDAEDLGVDLCVKLYCNPPRFRDNLPWTERIQQVGPTIEVTLRGET